MGYYIEGPDTGKAQYLIDTEKAEKVSKATALAEVDSSGIVVVMDNGFFEAAGYAFDRGELEAFTRPDDMRPKTFLMMDRARAEKLCGYKR